jgi:hypothetical protein
MPLVVPCFRAPSKQERPVFASRTDRGQHVVTEAMYPAPYLPECLDVA